MSVLCHGTGLRVCQTQAGCASTRAERARLLKGIKGLWNAADSLQDTRLLSCIHFTVMAFKQLFAAVSVALAFNGVYGSTPLYFLTSFLY